MQAHYAIAARRYFSLRITRDIRLLHVIAFGKRNSVTLLARGRDKSMRESPQKNRIIQCELITRQAGYTRAKAFVS